MIKYNYINHLQILLLSIGQLVYYIHPLEVSIRFESRVTDTKTLS